MAGQSMEDKIKEAQRAAEYEHEPLKARKWRQEAGLSLSAVASLVGQGCTRQHIANWERDGGHAPGPKYRSRYLAVMTELERQHWLNVGRSVLAEHPVYGAGQFRKLMGPTVEAEDHWLSAAYLDALYATLKGGK